MVPGRRERPPSGRSYARDVLVALCGGVGAARMLSGLVRVVPPGDITAIVNVGDDMELHGLSICPDLDTVTYTLAGMDNRETGWGVAGESWAVMDELARLGGEDWFRLGDRDLATHLFRTGRLRAGEPLSGVTAELARRHGIAVRLLPVTDDTLRTRVALAEASELGPPGTDVSFQDYFVRLHHDVPVRGVRFEGAGAARPAPGVMDAAARRRHHRGVPFEPRGVHRPGAGRSAVCVTPWWRAGRTWWACRPSSPAPRSRVPPTG